MKQAATHAAKQSIACALTCATALCVITPATHAQCQYEVTAIIQGPPCPFGGTAPLSSRGMNAHGHVAGSWRQCFEAADEAFYWTPETGLVTLPRPSGIVSAIATDINDNGTIIGAHRTSQFGEWTAFVFHPKTGQYTYLPPLHFGGSYLNAINNAGIAVGSRSIGKPGQSPNPYNAVIWNTNTGEVIDLGVGQGPNSSAADGNQLQDETVGWTGTSQLTSNTRAQFWRTSQMIDLGMLPGTTNSITGYVNTFGVVVGACRTPEGHFKAFIWESGKMTELVPPRGYDRVGIGRINDAGQISGRITNSETDDFYPYFWQHGQFHDLRKLIIETPPALTITGGAGTGNGGHILAGGTGMGNVAVVLTPAGQPTGDLNHDCVVDTHDLLMLLEAWGPTSTALTGTTAQADLNGDGVVNVADLLILLANWGH